MCNVAVLEFFINESTRGEFEGKRVLEVGSRYVNGSVRPFIEKHLLPREYLGVDLEPGKFVDLVLPAERLVEHFGCESFDVVVATELLEHVQDWRKVVRNMKAVLRKGGLMYITTRSFGFPFHAYPLDFWRFEPADMSAIFSDFEILKCQKDPEAPGVFLKAKKPLNWKPVDLSNIALYSMILGRRTKDIPSIEEMPLGRRLKLAMSLRLIPAVFKLLGNVKGSVK
jgi:SAM-dependent methyltransferase